MMDMKEKIDEKELKEKELSDVTGGNAPQGGWECGDCHRIARGIQQPLKCKHCGSTKIIPR